jgi:ABC-type polysaccharide/polyol phosphate export permease
VTSHQEPLSDETLAEGPTRFAADCLYDQSMIELPADDLAMLVERRPALAATAPSPGTWFKRRVGARQALRELWAFRSLIRALAERDLRVRYKQAFLGMAWALFTPIVLMLAFTLVFTKFGHVATNGVPYPLFSYIALIPWSFFSASVLTGGMSLTNSVPLLNKLYCPREVFPLGAIAVAAADALVSTLVLAALFPIEHYTPKLETFYAPIMILILLVFTLGVTLLITATVVYMRDLRIALPLIIQLALFVTPVAYGAGTVASTRAGLITFSILNPLVPVMDGLRRTVLLGQSPEWASTIAGAGSATVVLMIGFVLFKRLETGLADFA